MRVVLLTNALPEDQLGGLQRYVAELSEALASRGLSVTLLARRLTHDAPTRASRNGATVVRQGYVARSNPLYPFLYPVRSWVGTARLLWNAPDDVVVHGHFAVQSSPLATMRKRPFIYTFHAPLHKELIPEHRGRYAMAPSIGHGAASMTRRLESRLVQRADRTVVLSEFMRRELLAFAPQADSKCLVIPGGIDLEKFAPGEAPADRWADGSSRLLFTARRFVPRTGVRELVEAMPAIRAEHPGARLAIAGSGPLRAEIERMIGQLGVGDSVRLLGVIDERELIDWYRRANLVVMPTQQLEGFGLAAAEAMACGTPVLATPVGALPEVVAPLGDEFVAGGVESSAIATAVNRLLQVPDQLAEVSPRAHSLVAEAYGWGTVTDRYLQLYEEALDRRNAGYRG